MTIIHSSTPTRPRPKHDVYETPYNVAYSALQYLKWYPLDTIIDLGAGNGVWGEAYSGLYGTKSYKMIGVDIRDLPMPSYYSNWYSEADIHHISTYELMHLARNDADAVIGNPPFKHAEAFVRFALALEPKVVLFLLPLAFLESMKRGQGLFKDHPPSKVWVSMRRISFFQTEKSKTGDYATALFLWDKNHKRETILDWWDYNESS